MLGKLLLSVGGFFFATYLVIIYYIKAEETHIDNKIFKMMILFLSFEVFTELLATSAIYYFRDYPVFVEVLCRIHQIFSMAWILSVGLYSVTIGRGYKVDNVMSFLLKEKKARPVLIGSIIFILALPFTRYENVLLEDGAYMAGSAEYIQYIAGLFIIILFIRAIVQNKEELPDVNMTPVKIGIVAAIIQIVLQLFFPSILITTECFVFTTYLLYFTFENPDLYLIKELEIAKKKADDSNRSKTEFLSNMSHEIRTPINAIIGFSEGIEKDEDIKVDDAIVDISHIYSAGNNLLEIINNILDISKIENGEEYLENKEYIFSNLVVELKSIMDARLIDKKIKFITNIDSNTPSKLLGDRTKIFQVFLNILSNAAKYTEVGRITLTIKSEILGNNAVLHIKVADTGYGIKKEDYDKLFEKFSRLDGTTKKEIEGTGLGLIITKRLVTLMGGKIWFESEYGAGTTFYIDLPQKIVDKTPVGDISFDSINIKDSDYLDCSGCKALLVDDNNLNLSVTGKILEPYKFTIDMVNNGEDCVNKIKSGEQYDIIFLDHVMPKMDGIEVLHILHKLDGYIIPPIIAVTANAIAGSRERYLNEGFDGYLSKPINITELDKLINKVFKDRKQNNTTIEEIVSTNKTEEVDVLDSKDETTTASYDDDYLVKNGFNLEEAMSYLSDMNTFKDVLGFFYDDIDGQLDELGSVKGDLERYATLVHGLKSDCRSLGIKEFTDKAYEHELKSKEKDQEYINTHFNELVELKNKYKEIIKNYLGK